MVLITIEGQLESVLYVTMGVTTVGGGIAYQS
jgi:hypothetical protein